MAGKRRRNAKRRLMTRSNELRGIRRLCLNIDVPEYRCDAREPTSAVATVSLPGRAMAIWRDAASMQRRPGDRDRHWSPMVELKRRPCQFADLQIDSVVW
jgi:hypothetical protein